VVVWVQHSLLALIKKCGGGTYVVDGTGKTHETKRRHHAQEQ
jgi:hypothetical protein